MVAKLSVAVINTKETTDCICVKCLRCCLSTAWVKFLPLWVGSSFIFQKMGGLLFNRVLRRSTFDIFWGLFNLFRFYAKLLTSLCSHPFPFFPFVMLSIFLLNFLIFSAIARPTRSCDNASNWYPRCWMPFWIKSNAVFGNVTSLLFQSCSPFTCEINEGLFSSTKGATMWTRSGLIGGSWSSEGRSPSHPL